MLLCLVCCWVKPIQDLLALKSAIWAYFQSSGQKLVGCSRHCAPFRPWSHPTFFFDIPPLTNDGGPGCYLQVSLIGPLLSDPTDEDLAIFIVSSRCLAFLKTLFLFTVDCCFDGRMKQWEATSFWVVVQWAE